MVGREVLLRVDKPPAQPKEPVLEVRDLHVARRPRPAGGPRRVADRPRAARSSPSPASTATARASWSRRSPGLRAVDAGHDRRRRRGPHGRGRARRWSRHGVAHIAEDRQRRGLVLNFTLAENLALREYNTPEMSRHGCCCSSACATAPADLIKEYDVRGGGPTSLATSLSGGNQQKCVIAREIAVQPARARSPRSRRAASTSARSSSSTAAWSPSATRAAAILLVSLEFEEVRSLADRIARHLRGRDRRRVPARRLRGGARHRDDRRRAPGGGRVSADLEPQAGQALAGEPGPRAPPPRRPRGWRRTCTAAASSSRCSPRCSPSSSAAWSILITGHNPISTYKAIFNGTGLNWFFPWISGDDRTTAALNLQQTLITTTPLILTGLAVAFAFRCGLFNIGGQGQYLVGSYRRGLGRLVVRRHAEAAAHRARDRRSPRWPARSGRGSPGC